MADLTKKAIAEGLKELCHHKDFNKISVRDITEQCGLNRQTFYYHFQDTNCWTGFIIRKGLFIWPAT